MRKETIIAPKGVPYLLPNDLFIIGLKACRLFSTKSPFSLHNLDESEHFVRPLVGVVLLVIILLVLRLEIFAPELIDLKAALVDVKVNIPLLKIRRAGLQTTVSGCNASTSSHAP